MSDVVEQCSQPHQLPVPPQPVIVICEFGPEHIRGVVHNRVVEHRRRMHHPEGVLEPRVHCPWINVIRPRKLSNAAESLEYSARPYFPTKT
jgi:hypothetical protein